MKDAERVGDGVGAHLDVVGARVRHREVVKDGVGVLEAVVVERARGAAVVRDHGLAVCFVDRQLGIDRVAVVASQRLRPDLEVEQLARGRGDGVVVGVALAIGAELDRADDIGGGDVEAIAGALADQQRVRDGER